MSNLEIADELNGLKLVDRCCSGLLDPSVELNGLIVVPSTSIGAKVLPPAANIKSLIDGYFARPFSALLTPADL